MQFTSKYFLKGLSSSATYLFASKKDLYEVLGISKIATVPEIKKAYYEMAKKYHPDVNTSTSAKEKYSESKLAYETLSDESKRRQYDNQTGDQPEEEKPFTNYANYTSNPSANRRYSSSYSSSYQSGQQNAQESGFDQSMFGDFASFFNGQAQHQDNSKAQNVNLALEISFMESIKGTSKTFQFEKQVLCSTCKGQKNQPGSTPQQCPTCGGQGSLSYKQGPMVMQILCDKCKGAGVFIKNPCVSCRGVGSNIQTVTETVNIPLGISSGQNILLQGKGHETGTGAGDLLIQVTVKPDDYFKRDGYDIITDLKITLSQAILGASIDVQTIKGNKTVKVLPGTQVGDRVRLFGMGVNKPPPLQNQHGDHIINLKIQIPKNLNDKQRKYFEELAHLEQKAF